MAKGAQKLKRGIAWLLSIVMILGVFPISAFADEIEAAASAETVETAAEAPAEQLPAAEASEEIDAPAEPADEPVDEPIDEPTDEPTDEPAVDEPAIDEPADPAEPVEETDAPEAPADAEIVPGDEAEYTLTAEKPEYTLRLTAERAENLLLSFTGAVCVSVRAEATGETFTAKPEVSEDGAFAEQTAYAFAAEKGAYRLTVAPAEPLAAGETLAGTLSVAALRDDEPEAPVVEPIDPADEPFGELLAATPQGKGGTDFHYVASGAYADLCVDGTYEKSEPTVSSVSVSGTLEAWALTGKLNKVDLTATVTITALPAGGALAVYGLTSKGKNGLEASKSIAEDVSVGDVVTVALEDGVKGVALVKKAVSDDDLPTDGTVLWANDDLYLTGKMPKNGVVEAVPVTVTVDGETVLAAYDIKIYASAKQQEKGKTWKPAGDKVRVHIRDTAFAGQSDLNVYHMADEKAKPEYVATVDPANGWVAFDADHFSIYTVTGVQLNKTVTTSDGATYDIRVTYRSTSGIPMEGTELWVSEIKEGDERYGDYVSASADRLGVQADAIDISRAFDIKIVDEKDHDKVYAPKGEVEVSITLVGSALENYANVGVLHFTDGAKSAGLTAHDMENTVSGDTVRFTTDGFSVYVVAAYTIETLVEASDGNTYRIAVEYDQNAGIPMDGAALRVSEILPDTDAYAFYRSESIKALDTDENHLALTRAFDIKIVDAANPDTVYEPQSEVRVTITLVGAALSGYADVNVLHFGDDAVSEMAAALTSDDTIRFATDSFSVYAVIGAAKVRTFYFYTFDEYLDYVPYYLNTDIGTEDSQTYLQIVREGETPVAPQNPVNPQDQEATFSGWYEGTANTADGPTSTVPYTFGPVPDLAEDDSVYLYAKFSRYIYVIFHDQYDAASNSFPVAFTRRLDLSSAEESDWYVDVTQYSVSYEDPADVDDTAMVFVGWSDAPITTPGASLNDDGDTVTKVAPANGKLYAAVTTHLYPIYAEAKWISYYSGPSGSHATFFTDTYYLNGIGPATLPGTSVMTRDGNWEFAGWYVNAELDGSGETVTNGAECVKVADADGSLNTSASSEDIAKLNTAGIIFENTAGDGEPASYRIKLTKNVKLYAYWTPRTTANYTVVIVKQNANDADDTDQSNNTYYYSESFTLSGTIGATLDATDSTLFGSYRTLNNLDAYNALHDPDLTDNEDNPYKNYVLSTLRSDPSVTVAENGSGILYFRYNWITQPSVSGQFTLRFVDPMAEPEYVIKQYAEETFDNDGTPYTADNRLPYNTPLNDKAPAAPVSTVSAAGLTFKGWYADRACTTRAFFEDNQEYQDCSGAKVLFATMPASDLTIYAGWTREWFLIKIDPNYGELYKHVYTDDTQTVYVMEGTEPKFEGTGGSTWMWKEYGDTFQEYTTIRRDYVESDAGSWYYVKHDRAYHGYPDTWISGESGERKTYYTKQPGEATELKTFEYKPGVYRYAGWYEVLFDANGNEIGEANTRYDFSKKVDHNITLRLRWQKVGAFYLQYDAGIGTLRHDEENEVLYLELDGDSYADDADVLITRTATAPAGYEFVGWRIRNDESGTVYRTGQTFHLLSGFMATVQSKRTVFLDAVYQQVPTATIVYHANGGVVAGGVTAATIDYGGYPSSSDFNDNTLVKTADLTAEDPTAKVSHIVNNSIFDLSDGSWLSMTDASFAGWCEAKVPDADHPLLTVGTSGDYRVGANAGSTQEEQTVHLYAIWQVNVKYHLNSSSANFGGTWDSAYTLNDTGDTYTGSAYVGSRLSWPPYDPVYTGIGNTSFLGWATRTGDSEHYTYRAYDFSQPVTGALDLYANWGTAPTCDVLVVDSSAYPTIAYAPWVDGNHDNTADGVASITLTSEHQNPADLIVSVTADAVDYNSSNNTTYAFSFATAAKATDMQLIQEERIDRIYYSPRDGKTHLVYNLGAADERDVALGNDEKLYFVYYQVQTPDIGYLLMEMSGNVTDITGAMDGNAPRSTANLTDEHNNPVLIVADAAFTISSSYQPMTWLPNSNTNLSQEGTVYASDITHYNFAIGAPGATNSSVLGHKTQAYTGTETGADARPDLYIKNTWQGLLFSQDGTTWFSAGTNPKLYVVFYTETPTVITLYNSTVGLAADMETAFTYDYWIEEIPISSSGTPDYDNPTLIFTTRAGAGDSKQLRGGDTFSAFSFTSTSHTYRVTFALTPKDGFTVTLPTLPTVDSCNAPVTTRPNWVGNSAVPGYYSTSADLGNTFSYTVLEGDGYCGKTAVLPFLNTRSYVCVDLHIAKAGLNGQIYHTHEWRVDATATPAVWNENNAYTVKIPLNSTVNLFVNHTYDIITKYVEPRYVPGALIYGHDTHTTELHSQQGHVPDQDVITLDEDAPLSCFRLAYEKVNLNDPACVVYDIYMKDDRNDNRYPLTDMANQFANNINGVTHDNVHDLPIIPFYRLYYLFYPAVTVYYLLENADGSLTQIDGDGAGHITYDGAQATMNGYDGRQQIQGNAVNVTQGQTVGIWERNLEVCQDVGRDENGNPYFNVPPLLDRWDGSTQHKLDLIYYKLGASTQDHPEAPHTNISAFPGNKGNGFVDEHKDIYSSGVTETLRLNIGIVNHKLQWKFEDEPGYQVLDNWPVIYAIYRERGYNLTVTKTVTEDTGYNEPYTVTISSTGINRDHYSVSGTGYSTIDATPAVPASNGNPAVPGVITFDVKDGDSVTIQGLIPGDYTVVETGNENDILSAKTVAGSTESVVDVTANSTVSFALSANTELKLTNEPKMICRVGTKEFHTLTSAVAYIADHTSTMTGTIEMLTDYLMPASDTPEIPAYLNVTLTTANDYSGSGTAATITRKSNVTTPMINNLGTFTLGDVILDGNNVTGTALINNEGTLTLGGSISVINRSTVTTTDPDTGVDTTTTTATPATVSATSPVLKNAKGSGSGGAIYSMKGAVNMIGGTIENCTAKDGGAIYAAAGTVDISGGTIRDNNAEKGGALYYGGEDTVTVSGGTIGESGKPNTAENGGAIYMASGTIDITGGNITYNEATASGGAIYALNAYVNVSGSADISHNTAAENGGAVHMETLTFKVTSGTLSYNSAANGGAVWSAAGSVEISGGIVSYNSAVGTPGANPGDPAIGGFGGAVYADASSFNMTGGTIQNSTANENGGGVYANSGSVDVSGSSTIKSNTADNGSGGGIYAATGAVSLNGTNVIVHGNDAPMGYGGALYVGSGAATLQNCIIGTKQGNYPTDANNAKNGSGVFVNEGSLSLVDAVYVRGNTATDGGAVGVGDAKARVYFSGSVRVTGNKLVSGGNSTDSNVYLNFDTDAIINFQSLGGSADVGIYVSDDPVTVDGTSTTVLARRGVPSARFGVYVDKNYVSNYKSKIKNDRTPNLTVANDATNKKLYWVRNFAVTVYYVADYTQGLPFGDKDYTNSFATSGGNFKKKIDNYNPPVYQMAASEIAADLRNNNSGMVSDSAVFGHAFVKQSPVSGMHYADYITDAEWVSDRWQYTTSTGSPIGGQTGNSKETLIFIYTEPYYLSIENNAKNGNQDLTLVISGLTVTVNGTTQSVINNYGYVFAKNDEIQNELQPVQASDLVLKTGESIRILLPGGKNMAYSLMGQYYSTYDPADVSNNALFNGTVEYKQRLDSNPAGATTGTVNGSSNFTVTGNTPDTSGQTHELIFGGDRAVCRVVADQEITGLQNTEYVNYHGGEGATSGKHEYTFSSPKQAYRFIENHSANFTTGGKVTATIEMLMDYMMPASDAVSLTTGGSSGPARDITFQTAVDGYFRYDSKNTKADGTGTKPRATISRGAGNNESFIRATTGTLTNSDYADKLTVQNLIFDGKNIGGSSITGGVVRTRGWNVTVNGCDFNNCQAKYGGGIYIESVDPKTEKNNTPYGSLTVNNSNFTNCQSLQATDKYGGGGIWTSMREMTLIGCKFDTCQGYVPANNTGGVQGGGVFHYGGNIDENIETKSWVEDCKFYNCSAAAGGSMECGAKRVTVKDCEFRNSTARSKNGGALNVWVYDFTSGSQIKECWVYLEKCTFENCYCLNSSNGNGGAMRSTAIHNTIANCTFKNATGKLGGAINITNSYSTDTTISGCKFTGCTAGEAGQGGAVYCVSKTLTVGGNYKDASNNSVTQQPGAKDKFSRCMAPNEGGAIYHSRSDNDSVLSMKDTTIDTCYSGTKGGGGVYTNAKTVSLTDSTVQNCYTAAANQNGGGLYLVNSTATTLSGTTIRNNTATGLGGGVYHAAKGTFTVTSTGTGENLRRSLISGNIAQGSTEVTSNNVTYQQSGGGIYTKALTFTLQNSTVSDNQAAGSGGGICQNYNGSDGMMTVNGATVTNNISGGMGGGIYTLTNMTLKGKTSVTGNRLTTGSDTANNAAGVYLRDGVGLTLGEAGGTAAEHVFDITNNRTVDGTLSDLRLPDITVNGEIVNDNKVKVFCDIGGEIRVVNANKKLTQFGTAQGSLTNPAGFTDEHKVFKADDGSLYGIVDRTDPTGKKIIWGGDPICKITDGNGRLLYIKIDNQHYRPAVFDRLDDGTGTGTSTTSAFSTLRGTAPLYYVNGEAYTGNDYQVKMLVENYTAEYYITATGGTGRNVTLTTAKTTDSMHPYRGREGTRCTILRDPRMDTDKALITANTNLTMTNIVLDGGSENGVTANTNTRVITTNEGAKTQTPIQITLDRNATLQNAACTGNGGGVYLNWGAKLAVSGGTIRNCSAANGGGVYIDGSAGTFTMSVGTITRCTASGNGGGVYFNKGTLADDGSGNPVSGFMRITGGSITRCMAQNGSGGGVYLNGSNGARTLYMSGGSIASNSAQTKGGGIFVGDNKVRIYFSGAPYVNGNTSAASVAPDKACNLEMDQTFTRTDLNPGTVIVSSGLNRGATIGVYVPEEDSGRPAGVSGAADSDTLYDKHGAEMDPFATFTDGNERGLNYFLNDRNGMKGGRLDNPNGSDYKIYWRIIYALSVKKQVLSDDPADMTTYRFKLTLTGEIPNTANNTTTTPNDINGVYGDMTFTNGVATFVLTNGQTRTADLLPLGFGYKIEEMLSDAEKAHFHTSVEKWDSIDGDVVTPSATVTGEMKTQSHFNYQVTFSNIHAICKVTDEQGRLLYTYNSETGKHVPAVYSSLVTAFNKVNAGNDNNWLRLGEDGNYYEDYPASYQIQMLIPECETEGSANLMNGRIALLTTADKDAEDGFPYVGGRDTAAQIKRGDFTAESMITVSNGSLTLGNITLDGNGSVHSSTADGGILNVATGSSLTVGTGATLQNSITSGSGAAVYLAQGATMNISGAPVLTNNISTGVSLGANPKNGDDPHFYDNGTPQDIFIAGYTGTRAESLVVTGDLTYTFDPNNPSADPTIYVWAAAGPHYIQNQQFAIMQGGTYTGLNVFRNAQTDAATQNPLRGDPKYLYGIARGTEVFWSGSMDLTVTKTVSGDFADPTLPFAFTVTVDGLEDTTNSPVQFDYARYESTNGVDWTLKSGYDALTGYPKKMNVTLVSPQDPNNPDLRAFTFTLKHNEKIVISIPRGTSVTVSEVNGYYTASYVISQVGSTPTSGTGNATGSIAMNADTTVAFTNHMDPPCPTGLRFPVAPFVLMMAAGLLLMPAILPRRRRRKED